jgi:hypothetical protein
MLVRPDEEVGYAVLLKHVLDVEAADLFAPRQRIAGQGTIEVASW